MVPVYTANRLQRWKLILLGYDFDLEYQKTTEFGQADVLSRLIPPRPAQTEDIVIAKIEQDILAVQAAAINALPESRSAIEEESRKGKKISQVIQMLQTGAWRSKPKEEIGNWKVLSHALSVKDGCLYFGHRIVIPVSLREAVLKQLHEGHPGMTRMKMLDRGYVYWTNINRDIEENVRHCCNCQEAAKMPRKTVLYSWTTEKKPWDRINIDYAGPLHGKMYLVVVDAYSKWSEFFEMSSSTTATFRELRMLFARYGNPRVIVSDNGTQFTAKEFQEFCDKQGIEHVRSPPFHPQSNGQAGCFVDTLKRTLQKIKEGGTSENLAEFLQCYRRTPCASTPGHLSPAEIFLGRQMRTPLTLLKETAKEEGTHNVRMEEQFNRHHGAQERSYHREDRVYVRDYRPGREKWIPARVKQRYGRAVSDMLTEGGDLWRRHANQMRGEEQHWVSCENTDAFDLPFHQENRRYKDMGETITDVEDNAEDRGTANVPLPTTTQPARRRRPPSRLQVDPKMKKYATRSSQEGGVGAVEINTDLTCYTS